MSLRPSVLCTINYYSTALHDPRSTTKLLTVQLIEKPISYIVNQHTKQAMTKRKVKEEFYKILNLITNSKIAYTTEQITLAQAVTLVQKVSALISVAHGLL